MLDLLRTRLNHGTRTSGFPKEAPEFPERFRGRPAFDASRCGDGCRECARSMPSALIQLGGTATMDVGACLFSPEEATACAEGAVSFTREYRIASSTRQGLRSATGEVELARALDQRTRRLFGRSLRLRSVAAGSCNGCEAELTALSNVVFDLARFGVQFVASPRHADGIVITGAVSSTCARPCRRPTTRCRILAWSSPSAHARSTAARSVGAPRWATAFPMTCRSICGYPAVRHIR